MTTWPQDNQAARNAFYGDPGKGQIAAQMVPVVPPFRMTYTDENGTKVIKSISFHRKCAPALLAALNEIWDYCQHDQAKIDASGASKYFGAYNPRKVRGSATKWSNHAYAAAIDLNANQNAMGTVGNMPGFIVDAFTRQGAMWGGWYKTRPDWMHFEFVDNGGRTPKSPPPVFPPITHLFDDPTAPSDAFEEDHEDEPAPVEHPMNGNGSGINVQPIQGEYDVDVEILQQKLLKLNYKEIGDADGYWGGKTRGAVTAFMNDRGQPTDGSFTTAVSIELNKALGENWSRPIAPARANATAKDIAPKVEAVRQSLWQRLAAKIAGFGAGGMALLSGISDKFSSINAYVEPFKAFFAGTPTWVWFALLALGAAVIYLSADKIKRSSVEDYNVGKIN